MAAIIIVAGLILLGNQGGGTAGGPQFDFSQFPTKGNQEASVTFIDFSNYG